MDSRFIFFLISIFLFQGIKTLVSLCSSLRFLTKEKQIQPQQKDSGVRFFIFIPCLNEQENILQTIEYFEKIRKISKANLFIYTITTGREIKILNTDTTRDILESEIKTKEYSNVFNIHDPSECGFVSHQFNYAIHEVSRKHLFDERDYIVFYNADSRPHPHTFNWVSGDIEKNGDAVYQQFSAVFKNFDEFGNSPYGMILKTFAVFQTRFSLSHEIPRSRRSVSKNFLIRKYSNAHCISHGLFISHKTFKNIGKFSENTMIEDLFLGFLLRVTGNAIKPIPYMENIDSPTSIWKNLRQKYIWYWGPMYYPYYYWYFLKNFQQRNNASKLVS